MKSIFLSDKPKKLMAVYDDAVTCELVSRAALDTRIYSKADVISDPTRFSDVEVIFSTWGMPSFSREEISACFPALRCVFYAAGSVQAFARPFLERGVRIFSAWAANAVPVAEYTVAQIILANKGFFAQARLMAQERYKDAVGLRAESFGNYRARIGLIGCGMIGSLVAKMLREYDLEVAVFDPYLREEQREALGVAVCSLEEIFEKSLVVSNHLANNAATKGMLGYSLFASMPRNATFINTGRGAQVVEAELVRALRERPDLTAVLDVTEPEPPEPSHPFYSLPNCYLTPHIAGSLGGEVVRMAEYMLEEHSCWSQGLPTRYEVSLKMLETMA